LSYLICVFLVIAGYISGSIPTGYYLYKKRTGNDIRNFGSHSTGGSNVWRLLGAKMGILVMIIDAIKGFIPAQIAAMYLKGDHGFMVGMVAISPILGHIYSCLVPSPRFKAGKGVATTIGVSCTIFFNYLPLFWVLGIIVISFLAWIIGKKMAGKEKAYIGSFAVLSVMLFLSGLSWLLSDVAFTYSLLFVTGAIIFVIIVAHRPNWERLRGK
jgi:acyl phosphate:glycerol-3-phosphate acyltransferase